MLKSLILAVVLLVGIEAHAKNVTLNCLNPENHTLTMSIDDSVLNGNRSAPQRNIFTFIFDDQKFVWNVSYMSMRVGSEEIYTLFERNATEKFSTSTEPESNHARIILELKSGRFEFECNKSI